MGCNCSSEDATAVEEHTPRHGPRGGRVGALSDGTASDIDPETLAARQAQEESDAMLAQLLFQEQMMLIERHQRLERQRADAPPRSPNLPGLSEAEFPSVGRVMRYDVCTKKPGESFVSGDCAAMRMTPQGSPTHLTAKSPSFGPGELRAATPSDAGGSALGASTASVFFAVDAMECPLCMEDLTVGCELRVLYCTHVFHKECIDDWLKRKRVCPLCQQDVTLMVPRNVQPVRSPSRSPARPPVALPSRGAGRSTGSIDAEPDTPHATSAADDGGDGAHGSTEVVQGTEVAESSASRERTPVPALVVGTAVVGDDAADATSSERPTSSGSTATATTTDGDPVTAQHDAGTARGVGIRRDSTPPPLSLHRDAEAQPGQQNSPSGPVAAAACDNNAFPAAPLARRASVSGDDAAVAGADVRASTISISNVVLPNVIASPEHPSAPAEQAHRGPAAGTDSSTTSDANTATTSSGNPFQQPVDDDAASPALSDQRAAPAAPVPDVANSSQASDGRRSSTGTPQGDEDATATTTSSSSSSSSSQA